MISDAEDEGNNTDIRIGSGRIHLFTVTSEESRRHFVDDGSPAPATEPASVRKHL